MQQAKMQDLTTTLLCRGKWEEPGGLRFENEVREASYSGLYGGRCRGFGILYWQAPPLERSLPSHATEQTEGLS